jgi:CheY-like chemotaxis protein
MNRLRDRFGESGRRVLVVAEDPVTRLAIDQQLDVLRWEAVSVNDGTEAIRVIEMGLLVHVLLINLRLPDLDARAVAEVIATIVPHIRVAFMADHVPSAPMEPRHAPLLVKPFSTSLLANALSGAIQIGDRNQSR